MKPRDYRLIVVSGVKRIGKTNETIRQLLEYCKGTLKKIPRKCLLFDFNGEFGNYKLFNDNGTTEIIKIKELYHNDIIKFSAKPEIEMRRIVPINNNTGLSMSAEDVEKLLIKIITYFKGGCVFIDDLRTIFGDSLPQKFASFLINNAHRDSDIILHVHSIGDLLPKLWKNTNILRFHYQLDSVEESKDKIGKENFKLFKLAQLIVNKQYDLGRKRFFVYVDKDYHKIRSRYPYILTDNIIKTATEDFLLMYDREVRQYSTKKSIEGKVKYSYKESFRIAQKELIEKYF